MTAADVDQPPLPRRLQVEVTAACNLRCRMCIVRYRPAFPRSASMTLRRFERLLDALPSVREVVLQGVGEPLLAPDLYDMIAATTARGIDVEFNSNATLLTRAAWERLIAAGLAALHLSLDGSRQGDLRGHPRRSALKPRRQYRRVRRAAA
ncbi:MAG: radical SAM protein [Dehalococcoidia bacterium]